MPHHGGASLPTASDFQPPYFPPPFPSHHHAPASPQHPGLAQPQHLDYLVGDPYTQTLNTLHQHHYNHLSAAVTAGQRSGDLRRDAEGIHVVRINFDYAAWLHKFDKIFNSWCRNLGHDTFHLAKFFMSDISIWYLFKTR